MNRQKSYFDFVPDTLKRRPRNQKTLICIFIVLCVALCVGSVLIWYFKKDAIKNLIYDFERINNPPICSGIPDSEKLDCYPDSPVTETQCVKRGCCYSVPDNGLNNGTLPSLGVPYCFYPTNYVGYIVTNVTRQNSRIVAKLKRNGDSGFPKDVRSLLLSITFIDDCSLRIKITDANSPRYEVPIPLYYQTKKLENPCYEVDLEQKNGVLKVMRKVSGAEIFSSNFSRLVYSDQLLQISSNLPSPYVYGIGEHYGGLLRNVNWTRFTFLNSDLAPIPNHSLYGSQPFYMVLENDGKASGVFLFNSNPMDVILQPAPAITFRPIGGILDFFIMLGPTPEIVVQQYANIVGRTFMPPYWSLGFHLCRYGYYTLNKTKEVMQRTVDAGIPLDVQWNDIDYMDRYKDFTYDNTSFSGLPNFVEELHAKGMHYVIITDPGISNSEKSGTYSPYDEGVDDDIFVKNSNGSIFVGKVWTDGTTVYPDFSHPAASSYWTRQIRRFHNEVKFDGLWIDMNEPSNFLNGEIDGCPASPLDDPPYVPGGVLLRTKTLCMSARHYYTVHYNEHNIYGYREAAATNQALRTIRKKRPFVISRATFSGQGVHGGHWSGDISSSWDDMRYSIPSLLNFNMYGMPMIGSDICGFNYNTSVELCARWQALGAFYPFSRNHNERVTIEQDPVALGPVVVEATKNTLVKRYLLLPYLYTLFYRSHAFGNTVVKPLFFEFPEDVKTYAIDEQFLWGSGLMIIPALYPNTSNVNAYFPKGIWYDKLAQVLNSSGQEIPLLIPMNDTYLAVRGGYILPGQFPALTTTASRQNGFILIVPMNEMKEAYGELYWDDGDTLDTYENENFNLIEFYLNSNVLNSTVIKRGYDTTMNLEMIQILGLDKSPDAVFINGVKCTKNDLVTPTEDYQESVQFSNLDIFNPQKIHSVFTELNSSSTCIYAYKQNIFFIFPGSSLLSSFTVTWSD